jgi:hypothetical protein
MLDSILFQSVLPLKTANLFEWFVANSIACLASICGHSNAIYL